MPKFCLHIFHFLYKWEVHYQLCIFDGEFLFVRDSSVIFIFASNLRKQANIERRIMGTKFFYTIRTQFDFVNNKLFEIDFVCDSMYRVTNFIWNYAFYLFGLLFRQIFRFQKGENFEKDESHQIGSSWSQDSEIDKNNEEEENSVVMETNRYEFSTGKGIYGFVEQPMTFRFSVHEMFVHSRNDAIVNTPIKFDSGGSIDQNFQDVGLDTEKAEEKTEKAGDLFKSFVVDEVSEMKQEHEKLIEEVNFEEELFVYDRVVNEDMDSGNHELKTEETEYPVQSLVLEEVLDKPEVKISTEEKSYDKEQTHSTTCEILSDGAVNEVLEPEIPVCINEEKAEQVLIDGVGLESCVLVDEEKARHKSETEAVLMTCQSTDSDDEYIELQLQKQNSILLDEEETLSRKDFSKFEDKHEELLDEKADPESEGHNSSKCYAQSDADYMLEHQEIIDQLKTELKLARTGGLPTILEESESEELETPRTVQELKPMKINDQKLESKDFLDGIQKVYKSYSDKMRKLDILNFQTMHALGLLQMKETVQFQTARKSSVPAIMSSLSQNLWSCKGFAVIDPIKKVIADMHKDFETIYVGQLCLSWEILNWQYWKIQELQKLDSQRSYQYNQVAAEFQLFQVMIQRFLENEQFQGPRVQNYVKNRCVLRSLLQVPLVKDDSFKSKDEEDKITSEMLKKIIQQSMIVFWEFLHADKDESNMISYSHNHQTHHVNLQDLVDSELLTDIRTDFQKKEKKLKDILRSGNCIVKRFKKQQEGQIHGIHTLFIAQVEIKLVSRVLNMSKLTRDQLIWCHEKLDKIKFCNRKVSVESSFLLLPCRHGDQ